MCINAISGCKDIAIIAFCCIDQSVAFSSQLNYLYTSLRTVVASNDQLPFQGILFSLNARNSRQEYISLELNEGRLELVHSLPNGSKIIDIPAKINDGHWHQLAIRYVWEELFQFSAFSGSVLPWNIYETLIAYCYFLHQQKISLLKFAAFLVGKFSSSKY